ncbi:molybdenum transporter [Spirochaetia bacterium]|nr:molybdenum transporter [Spirochaetia bacterium]
MFEDVKPALKVSLITRTEKGEPFCGPGMIKLLLEIRQNGNVRDACEKMGMSYSKAWKLLDRLERWLGFTVVARQQGGRGGGEAHLTGEGAAFLEKHCAFLQECETAVGDIFNRYYSLNTK